MDYEILKGRYMEGESFNEEDFDCLVAGVEELIKNGNPIDCFDREILMDSDREIDTEIADVNRHGWVQYASIYKIDNRFFRLDYSYHDDVGVDFYGGAEPLPEVEPHEVTVTKWHVKGTK